MKQTNEQMRALFDAWAKTKEYPPNGTRSEQCFEAGYQAALASMPRFTEWQPIETAPKDGTVILLATSKVDDGHMQTAYWDECDGIAEGKTAWAWHHTDAGLYWHKDMFTHWMPLPAAPHLRKE